MSNPLVSITATGQAITTSLIIAEGTQNEHASVIKLVRQYASDLEEFGTLRFEIQKSGGRPTEFAYLDERQSSFLLTLMKNNEVVVDFKKRLVKAFWELAKQPMMIPRLPTGLEYATMLVESEKRTLEAKREAATYKNQAAALELKTLELEPKAEVYDKIVSSDGLFGLRVSAKILQKKPHDFTSWLRNHRWTYREGGKWVPYQDKINHGLMFHRAAPPKTMNDGTEREFHQAMITAKGLAKLAQIFGIQAAIPPSLL